MRDDEGVQGPAMPSWFDPDTLYNEAYEAAHAKTQQAVNAGKGYESPLVKPTPAGEHTPLRSTPSSPVTSVSSAPMQAMTKDERSAVPQPMTAATPDPAKPESTPAAVRQPSLGDHYRQMAAATLNQYGTLAPGLDKAEAELKAAQQQQLASYDNVPFRPLGFYEQLTKTLNPYKPPTAAEIQRRIKRERGQKTIAAIGDGISALANLWGTSQGALNAYTGTPTLSGRYADMYETLRQERKANDEKYYATYLNALAADDANAAAIRGNEATKAALNVQNAQTSYASLLGILDKLRDKADKYDKLAADQDAKDRDYQLRVDTLQQRAEDNAANRELRREIAAGKGVTVRVGGGGRGGGGGSTSKTMEIMTYGGKDKPLVGSGIYVPQSLWKNDTWISSVYDYVVKSNGLVGGAKPLMHRRRGGTAADKRMTLSHILQSGYAPEAQLAILDAIKLYSE